MSTLVALVLAIIAVLTARGANGRSRELAKRLDGLSAELQAVKVLIERTRWRGIGLGC